MTPIPIKNPKPRKHPWLEAKTRAPFSSTDQPEGRGRPKGSVSIVTHIRRLLSEKNELEAKKLGKAMIRLAKKGNQAAIKTVVDRIDGPLPDQVEFKGNVIVEVVSYAVKKNKKDNGEDSSSG